jgi:hypothetical protein
LAVGALSEKNTVAHEQRVHRLRSSRGLTGLVTQFEGGALERARDRQGFILRAEQLLEVGRVGEIDLHARRRAA